MKLLHTKKARSIWLFDIRDLNPKGKDLLGELVSWIKDSYGFAVAPDPDNPVPNNTISHAVAVSPQSISTPSQSPGGLLFQRGHFQAKEEIFVAIEALKIFDDGIVVDTTSTTEEADQFAEDLLKSAMAEFKLSYDTETIRRKLYLSELIVRSDLKLEHLNRDLAAFTDALPASIGGGNSLRFGVGSIAFWSEPTDSGVHRLFRIERQVGKAFSEQRFFSDAPLQTSVHLKLLEQFENIIMRTR